MRSLIVVLVASVALSSCSSETLDKSLLTDRLWQARKHRDERDLVPLMFFIDDDGTRAGIDGRASAWRIAMDIFVYRTQGKRMEMVYPQENKKRAVDVDVRGCKEKPGFDLCLTLSNANGTRRYYSNREQHEEDRALLADLRARAESAPSVDANEFERAALEP